MSFKNFQRKYDVGIIGVGNIASVMEEDRYARRYYKYLTHAGTFTRHPGFKVKCAADIDTGRLEAFRKKWGIKKLYRDYRDMIRKEKIDMLVISTSPETHTRIIKDAAGRVKLILCEKPLGMSLKEARIAVRACDRKKTKLAVNLRRHYDPSHRKVREYINSKNFGRIKRISCIYGKGVLNTGSHLIDMLLYLIGDVRFVQALFQIRQGYKEPTPDIFLVLKNNIPCVIQAVDYDDYRIFEIDIFGTRERIKIENEGLKIAHFKKLPNRSEKGAFELREIRPRIKSTMGEAFYHMADNMFQVLKKGAPPLCSGRDYLKVGRVLEGIIESAKKGGELVNIKDRGGRRVLNG